MALYPEHAITRASFAAVDKEIGNHNFTDAEYAVVRRVVHTTADFEFAQLIDFVGHPFEAAKAALPKAAPIVVDVSMVAAGIQTVVKNTWHNPTVVAVQCADELSNNNEAGLTRSAVGMRYCGITYPNAIFAIGNAPTALLELCQGIQNESWRPSLVVAAPVGFINVVEAKQALSALSVPHIIVNGRKGGSAVAAAILNALMVWTWERSPNG